MVVCASGVVFAAIVFVEDTAVVVAASAGTVVGDIVDEIVVFGDVVVAIFVCALEVVDLVVVTLV